MRVRDIRPDDVDVQSIWDEISDKRSRFFYGEVPDLLKQSEDLEAKRASAPEDDPALLPDNMFPKHLFYNDADAAGDAILFPEELEDKTLDPSQISKISPLKVWEDQGYSMPGFVEGLDMLDSDWDSEGYKEDRNDENDWEDAEDSDDDIAMEGGNDSEALKLAGKSDKEIFLSFFPEWQWDVMSQVAEQRRDIRPREDPYVKFSFFQTHVVGGQEGPFAPRNSLI